MSVHPFPRRQERQTAGTIHVYGDRVDGYTVSHESRSGGSWGGSQYFADAGAAITAAFAMNRDDYAGECDVYVGDGVADDAHPGVGSIGLQPGDF